MFSFSENALASASAKKNDLKANSCKKKKKQSKKQANPGSAEVLLLSSRITEIHALGRNLSLVYLMYFMPRYIEQTTRKEEI